MSSITFSIVVLVCAFASWMAGMLISPKLPDQHLSSDSKDVVRLGMGLVATTVALVLGLLVSSAKSFYDTQNNEVTQLAANLVVMDRILAHYGPETGEARAALRDAVAHWRNLPESGFLNAKTDYLFDKIQDLNPKDENQKTLKAQATSLAIQMGEMRWLMYEQKAVPVPKLLLAMLISWLVILFASFGLFAPRNLTVQAGLFMSALAVSGAIFLILEMYQPYTGLIRVSDAPLKAAVTQLER
jgi:hypothetical protein